MKAIVWRDRIDILGAALPKENWEPLLDDLKAEHVPALTPRGKRLSVVVGPSGRIDTFIYRTHEMSDGDVVKILGKYGIAAEISSSERSEGAGAGAVKSFMLEALKGSQWDAETSELRFDNKEDAEEHLRRIVAQWGIAESIRVVPTTDPPNCRMAGGIGNRHLERF